LAHIIGRQDELVNLQGDQDQDNGEEQVNQDDGQVLDKSKMS
jgi:hypothetical protein